jgi:CRP/FNR family transcriptional regulator, nitrogen fixation regulation protein
LRTKAPIGWGSPPPTNGPPPRHVQEWRAPPGREKFFGKYAYFKGDILRVENGEVHRFTAEAIVNTTVWVAKSRNLFGELTKGDIPPANHIRDLVTRTLGAYGKPPVPLGPPNSVRESANFLLKIDRRLQQPELMILPMIRRDIADYLGLTFETVSRSLSTLRDEGILSFTRSTHREIVLHDLAKLVKLQGPA